MTESWPDDLARLLGAAQQWVRQSFPLDGHDHESDGSTRFSGPECQWCPICQLLAVLHGERPDVSARFAEAGAAFVAALRSLAEASSHAEHDPDRRVQPITLDDDEPDEDD